MRFEPADSEPIFTSRELYQYDGEDGLMYIAHQGIVYDVTQCPKWRKGLHEGQHFPGQDLTAELNDAPHGEEVFQHPCVRRVGRLAAQDPSHFLKES